MKNILLIIVLIVSTECMAQFSLNVGVDPKLLIRGTDNQYTTHNSVLNMHIKLEYHGRENELYFAIGIEQANLEQMYRAWFADFGVPIQFKLFKQNFTFIPQLEIGDIFREHINVNQYDNIKWDDTYYYGVNIPIRYSITKWLGIELEGSIDLASDLPDRRYRYGGKINVILSL